MRCFFHGGGIDRLWFVDKSDSAFTRSRSSSTSSLESGVEAVTSLTFADTLARKLGN